MHGETPPTMPRTVGVLTTDAALVVQSWDAWLEQHSGISASTAVGTPLPALVPDLAERKLLPRFEQVVSQGVVVVLTPLFHHYLLRCPPASPSRHFDTMQQHVTIAPLRIDEQIVGTIVTVEDMTARLDRERDLTAQLQSPDATARLQAAEALATAKEHESALLIDALADAQWRVRRTAVSGLAARAGADAVADILRAMREEHRDLALLNSALQVLALTDVDVVGPLIDFLEDPDTDLRIYAALALAEHTDPRAAAALIAALDDPDQNVRFHAIEALGKLRAAAAIEPLLSIAVSGDFFLAFAAIDALRAIGDARVAPGLVPLLADDMLRDTAAEALGALGDEEVIAPLLALLDAPDAPVTVVVQALAALYRRYDRLYDDGRRIAAQVSARLTPTARQAMLAALDTATPDELRALVVVLGWLEGPAVERALARLLGQPTVRLALIEALVRFGAGVVDALIEQLAAEDAETRAAAVVALGRIGDARVVPELIEVLETDPDLAVVAADALAKIGDHRAFEALLRHLGDPDVAARQAVISALHSLGHPDLEQRITALLHDPDPLIRESALRIAGYFGYDACAVTIVTAVEDRDERVQQAAIEALAYLDNPRCLPLLLHVLRHEMPNLRAAAARALGHMDEPEALAALLGALDDPQPWVRYFATRSLGQRARPDTLEPLIRVLERDTAGQVRIAAAEALGQIGGEQAAQSLTPLTAASDADLVRATLHALGQTRHPAALPPLLAALRGADPSQRAAAVDAVALHGGMGAVPALQWVAAADHDVEMQQAAITALSRVQTSEATAALIELLIDPQRREAVRAALARKGARIVDDLQRGLAHPHPAVRATVVEILARIKLPAVREPIAGALDDVDPAVRIAAVTALGRIGHQHAARKLNDLAYADPEADVRRAARTLLGR
ncbi:MAG TPA: HEAT repeat domain-containing protein [Herpetosiphonaceae bacterium]